MRHINLSLVLLLLSCCLNPLQAQTTIWQEDFSSGAQYSVTQGGEGRDGNDNYFTRTNGSSPNIDKSYSGTSGYFFAGQDIDDGGWSGSSSPSQLTWSGIDISGLTSLSFSGKFGEVLDGTGDIDDSDYLKVEYRIDGGSWQDLIAFQNDGSAYNTNFLEDTGFDGIGDGTKISSNNGVLVSFTKAISGTGSSLDLRFTAAVSSGDEDFAIDDFALEGQPTNPDTKVRFSTSTMAVPEDTGSTYLPVTIDNNSGTTSFDVVFKSGSASNVNGFVSNSLSTSSSADSQLITIPDNAACNEDSLVTFAIRNVSGGSSASVGTDSLLTLTVQDDEGSTGTISYQGFEGTSSDTWSYTASPSSFDDGSDYWEERSSAGSINPVKGSRLWGSQDLQSPSGTSGWGTLAFDQVDLSSASDVTISFQYHVDGFDNGDDLRYGISYDNGNSWTNTKIVDGSSNFNTSGWVKETIAIPDLKDDVTFRIQAQQNGGSDQFAIDDVSISGSVCNVCDPPSSPASSLTFSNITNKTIRLDWTNGDGEQRIVVGKKGDTLDGFPKDSVTYAADTIFGNGDMIPGGAVTLGNGTADSLEVGALTPGATYTFGVLEYNCGAGKERYIGTYASDSVTLLPENVSSLTSACRTSSSIDLNWNTPAGESDGWVVFARQGQTPASPITDASNYTGANNDFSNAPAYGARGKLVYKGNATNMTVKGLSSGKSYTFKAYTYSKTQNSTWSNGKQITETATLNPVTSAAAIPSSQEVELSWTNPNAACFDDVMIVAKDSSAPTFTPSGNGSSYQADTAFGSGTDLGNGEYVVYKNNGSNVTVGNLTNGTEYFFSLFVRDGSEWSDSVVVSAKPDTTTTFSPGDLAILAINTKYKSNGSDDEISFLTFADIDQGTTLDFTDNGYERENSGRWGETEGTIRLQYTGSSPVQAGKVITIRGKGSTTSDFTVLIDGTVSNDWSIKSINSNTVANSFDLNVNDQIWFSQNGNWQDPSAGYDHDVLYEADFLYGWTATGWAGDPGHGTGTKYCALVPGMACFNTNVTGVSDKDKVKYTGPLTATNQREWINRINDSGNWTGYSSNSNYQANGPDYAGGKTLDIVPGGYRNGRWIGAANSDWFDCENWENLRVPDEKTNVVVPDSTTVPHSPVIDNALEDADCKTIHLRNNGNLRIKSGSKLKVGY